ncbi:hypothetical protein [Halopenitus persicus]|uniref:hypothetical protein n=1 Tax=Halopenitus persicus TaxID=1048396 RepID=UPI000BBB6537|nr:hypothetical protein [Halopenitus persicus]
MQLTQDNVQNFVDGVMKYYGEKTLLGEATYVDDYGSANIPVEKRRVTPKLKMKQFNRGIAADQVKKDIDDITSFEQDKLLNWLEAQADMKKQVDGSEFSKDLMKKILKPLSSPVYMLLPDKMEYRLRVNNDSYIRGNNKIPITWFTSAQFDQTGFVLDRGARVLQKRQGDDPIVGSSLNVGALPKDNSGNGLIMEIRDDKKGDLEAVIRSEFTELRKSDRYDSVCLLDLPSLNLP